MAFVGIRVDSPSSKYRCAGGLILPLSDRRFHLGFYYRRPHHEKAPDKDWYLGLGIEQHTCVLH